MGAPIVEGCRIARSAIGRAATQLATAPGSRSRQIRAADPLVVGIARVMCALGRRLVGIVGADGRRTRDRRVERPCGDPRPLELRVGTVQLRAYAATVAACGS